ncbi:transglycosylase SLT domain-containing protein [Streptomyces sp. H51]|uniref:transglycosylase SLT domain-containing protein n=1 Tax=Streptomyces sp. H51 TaxID=3111770 RepID=UPI002D78FF9D|nr:transglycosylase SLT domain-containing protein [Streptomyces sp. H51]
MLENTPVRGLSRVLTRHHRIALSGVAALGAAALAFTAVPGGSGARTTSEADSMAPVAYSAEQIKDVRASVTDQLAGASLKAEAIKARAQAKAEAAAKAKADAKAGADARAAARKQAAEAAAGKQAEAARKAEAANRSAQRPAIEAVAAKTYANNLDGWIRKSLDIMKSKGIPGSYSGLHRNIMRESSGNPNAINNWDINAINGIPSKGLLQVIPPTFKAYHVPGTSWNIYDPVANITAAANYAAHRYGSIDNVNSAY